MQADVRQPGLAGRRNSLEDLEALALDVLSQVKPRAIDPRERTLPGAAVVSELPVPRKPAEEWRPCPHCGNKVASMYRSCRHCGNRVE